MGGPSLQSLDVNKIASFACLGVEGGSGSLAEQAEMVLQLAPVKMFTCSFLSHLSQTLSSDTNKAKRKCNLLKKWCLYYKEKRKKLVMIEYLR